MNTSTLFSSDQVLGLYPASLACGLLAVLLFLLVWGGMLSASPANMLVARFKGFKWDRHSFCQHFLITGATGSGKTLGGILRILFQAFKHQPGFGGLCVDVKGSLHEKVTAMAAHFSRSDDVVVLKVRGKNDPEGWKPTHRLNLIGDRSIPFHTYARYVVDTASALGNRKEQSFFRRAAQIHIGMGMEALHVLGYDVTLENTHNLLVNSADTLRAVKQLTAKGFTGLAEHFRNYQSQPPEQLAGIIGTIGNYLHYFTTPAIAEVFCRESTFNIRDIDQGKIICLAMSQMHQTERRFVGTFLKLCVQTHGLSRFDATPEERAKHNLLLLLQDEFQQFASASEDGMSDHTFLDLAREAGVAVVAATQSTTSLVPLLGIEAAKVLTLNMRNRLIFTSADEDDAKASAEFIGKKLVRNRSWTWSNGKRSQTFTETEDYKLKPHELRKLRKHQCIVVHASGKFRKVTLPPLEPDGTVSRWYRRFWFTT